jgi:F420H(2)-dependent biliverdin reductase
MAPPTRSERLETDRNLWLAAVRADGRPHLTPIWFVWFDDRAWLCTGRKAVKARIVAARPLVSFALEDGNSPVTAEGTAALVEAADTPSGVADLFRTKYAWDISQPDGDLGDLILIAISVTRWLSPAGESPAD